MLLRDKKILTIIFFAISLYPLVKGVTNLSDTNEKVIPIDISKLGISTTPYVLDKPYFVPKEKITGDISNIKFQYMMFDMKTNDTFAVGNPILANFTAQLEPDSKPTSIFLTFVSSKKDPRMNSSNLNDFVTTHLNKDLWLIPPLQDNNLLYNGVLRLIPTTEGDVTPFIIANRHDGSTVEIWLTETIVSVKPYTEKLQADANRLAIIQIPQNQKATDTQLRNNEIIEGLSWLIVAWIPLELITRVWFR